VSRCAQLGQPRTGRSGGDAQDVYPAGGVLDDESLMVGSAIRETLISGRDTVLDTQKPATQR